MTLAEFLRDTNTTMYNFSGSTGIKIDTLNKYKYGNRIPTRDNMVKILEATSYKVQANDFYYTKTVLERVKDQ